MATIIHWMTRFKPLARLIARNGRKTRNTRRILIVDTALDAEKKVIRDTQTTRRSNKLAADRQNAPSWKTNPYTVNFRVSSIVNTEVKK